MTDRACLFLIPVTIDDGSAPEAVLPAGVIERIRATRDFVVENAKTARRFLSACGHPGPIASLGLAVLDEHTKDADVPALLAPLRAGRPLGLMSEAGVPAVADPGARLVAAAHAEGLRVVPLVGPSSILLALMASGLQGQRFRFVGYLPVPGPDRQAALRDLEARSAAADETQVFIETPYRNAAMLADVLGTCRDDTLLAVAAGLTGASEKVRMASVAEWRRRPDAPGRQPAIFLLHAARPVRRR